MAWANLTTNTLTGASDTITTSVITSPKQFIHVLLHSITSGSTRVQSRLGNSTIDAGSNYSNRISDDGLADTTNVSQSRAYIEGNPGTSDRLIVQFGINISTNEKLLISFMVNQGTTGAGNAPKRAEAVFKWVNTSNQANVFENLNDQSGDFATDSNLTVFGTD